MTDTDHNWMQQALALAARGEGCVEPNPMVGAVVLAADGTCVGQGWHQAFGGPHAEVFALREAEERARGGTLYVTLEPCCHHGKTPPCTDAVLRSGVRRVVVAMADPFPKVAGGGIAILRDAGIEVVLGVGEAEARALNAPYLMLVTHGRPWVHAKWAMSLDGKIATRTGASQWISSPESRERVHALRGRMDGILVGRGTVWADDPRLTARPAGPRTATRIVVARSGILPTSCHLTATAREVPVLVFVQDTHAAQLSAWQDAGCEVIPLADLSVANILAELGRRRMTHLLVEGGGGMLGAFADARMIDEVHAFLAPRVIGGEHAAGPVAGEGFAQLAEALTLENPTWTPSGPDLYCHGRVRRS